MDWLEGLKGGAPAVFGALIGSLVGFGTLVIGALFNAKLSRDRDDRLRKVEVRGVAAALRAELSSIDETLTDNAQRLRDKPPTNSESFLLPDLSHSVRMFPALSSKLGGLDDPLVIQEIIQIYIVIDQYYENCLLLGGQPRPEMPNERRLLLMPSNSADHVATMNFDIAVRVKNGVGLLNKYLY
ncbi:hypothetical protein BjapCC829_39790 [Bradyrhizobium barranii]|uniref:Uncharacterized protein n=1 Tax=Bradyrhizobium barranii TaxID=2992140 RepID=A0ABY3QJB7_9BRAD|nr:hypothetical protein [Bradyrhizobium japonicum]UFW85968.1 hypothetical protein BjapCC829_39790 [Bradyrhizobium japonicum]